MLLGFQNWPKPLSPLAGTIGRSQGTKDAMRTSKVTLTPLNWRCQDAKMATSPASNDGQCDSMEHRCDQMPQCRDTSDKIGCDIMVLKARIQQEHPPNQFKEWVEDCSRCECLVKNFQTWRHKGGGLLDWNPVSNHHGVEREQSEIPKLKDEGFFERVYSRGYPNTLDNKKITLRIKMAIYCPQGSGTLRQQLLIIHGIALYCMVLHGIAWYCMVLHGIAW